MANYQLDQTGAEVQAILDAVQDKETTRPVLNSSKLITSGAVRNALIEGYLFKGVADHTTNPGTPTEKVFYIATEPGTYQYLGDLVVNDGEVVVLKYDTAWHKEVTGAATTAQVTELGQEIDGFVEESDSQEFIELVLDAEKKILESRDFSGKKSVFTPVEFKEDVEICEENYSTSKNDEYVIAETDADKKIHHAVKKDGTHIFPAGLESPTIKRMENNVAEIISDQENSKIWNRKKIAWYGTSIPAGTSLIIPFKGNRIKALLSASTTGAYPSGRMVETNREECPHEYPIMVGTLLPADVYNQAVGSSKAGKSYVGSKTDLYLYCKSLANSVKDILDVITNCYSVDWAGQTFSANPTNDYGINTYFGNSYEDTWQHFVGRILECLSFSYEISIVSRYLISDENEHSSYVQEIFGTYYESVSDSIDLDALCGFKADIDMFVFDHGCNDGKWASGASTPISEGILSSDPTTFEGAYNLFIETIYRYRANARIVIIGSYYNWQPNSVVNRIEVQEAIARRWQFPFINMSRFMPASTQIAVLTQGYWEDVSRSGVSLGRWHEEGFSYDATTGESNNALFSHYSLTKEQIGALYSPQQINGKWYWNAPMMKLWCYDEPHPHSDADGRLSKILARLLGSHLELIGNI